jgi:hypothetical protein
MTDPGTVLGLAKKSLDGHRILGQARAENLYRCDAALRVLRAVYSRGSTLADILGELVTGDCASYQGVCVHGVAKLVNLA